MSTELSYLFLHSPDTLSENDIIEELELPIQLMEEYKELNKRLDQTLTKIKNRNKRK